MLLGPAFKQMNCQRFIVDDFEELSQWEFLLQMLQNDKDYLLSWVKTCNTEIGVTTFDGFYQSKLILFHLK